MVDRKKPRHIRDIAHLYLSRAPSQNGEAYLLAAGTGRECFPGFHTVNVALVLSARGYLVDLVDISAQPLCAGFFLGLPPAVYLESGENAPPVSALGRITLAHSLCAPEQNRGNARQGGRRVRIVHLPPVTSGAHEQALERATEERTTLATMIFFAAGEGPRLDSGYPKETYVVDVDGPARSGSETAAWLGRIDRWHGSLCDPIPPVLRDPQSMLARDYESIVDALVPALRGAFERKRSTNGQSATARTVRTYRGRRNAAERSR